MALSQFPTRTRRQASLYPSGLARQNSPRSGKSAILPRNHRRYSRWAMKQRLRN